MTQYSSLAIRLLEVKHQKLLASAELGNYCDSHFRLAGYCDCKYTMLVTVRGWVFRTSTEGLCNGKKLGTTITTNPNKLPGKKQSFSNTRGNERNKQWHKEVGRTRNLNPTAQLCSAVAVPTPRLPPENKLTKGTTPCNRPALSCSATRLCNPYHDIVMPHYAGVATL